MMSEGMQAIGYCRVSTREQGDSGHGLHAQETAIRAAATRRGWNLVDIERDVISTRQRHRPALERAMQRAAADGAVLVAAHSSRVSRSTVELLTFHGRAVQEGWHLLALDMEHIDTTTPIGTLIATVIAAFNQFERDNNSQRTKLALAEARADGVRLGRPNALEQGKRPEERARLAAALPRLRELRDEGLSYRAVADALNEEGLPGAQGGRWWARTVREAEARYGAVADVADAEERVS